MTTCQSCQAQLLEYVYGLFDENVPAEAGALAELRAHLKTCAACQAAHDQAKKQENLLKEASRARTRLTFSAPKVESQRTHFVHQRSTHVAWYVTAASLIFALLIGSSTAYWWGKATKWNNVELAKAQLDRLRDSDKDRTESTVALETQIQKETANVEKLTKAVKQLQEQTKQQLEASTSYQQILAPSSVTANNDAPVVVWNNSLAGKPLPVTEVTSNLLDSMSQRELSQMNRRNESDSYKLSYEIPSVAYSTSAGKNIINEVAQDTSRKMALGKIIHPIQVLPARFTAHLCTDKPIYQPGEEVFFRGVALEKTTFQVPQEELHYAFKLTGPDEKVLKQWSKKAQLADPRTQQPIKDVRGQLIQGVGGESFILPTNMPLGECTLTLTEKNDRFDMQTVKFMVNNLAAPRLDKQLQFNRASYTPGDEVVLSGKIKLPSQQPWVHGNIKGQILIDGMQYDVQGQMTKSDLQSSTDASGNVKLAFRLPAQVEIGQGTLSLQLLANDGVETWSHPIRIETGMLQVDCYPEGGDLIASVPNTVYFQMRNKYGEAVEGEADLVDSKQKVVQSLSTFHDETEAKASRGMGMFQFIPTANESYHIRMKKPVSSQVALRLPAAKPDGVSLHIEQPVVPAGSPLPITLRNVGRARQLAVSVHCRGVLIALDQLSMGASTEQIMQIHPTKPLGGVYRVTVSEIASQNGNPHLTPLAERLIYRHPDKALKLNLKTEPMVGNTVKLQIDSRTETNQPSPAYVTIVGVNKSLLQMAEATTTRRLPAHFLIAQEVRQPEDLEFADFFLSRHTSAPHALDLLLGVQGWRRFIETDEVAVLKQIGQNLTDKLPVYCYDNRQETINRIEQQVKDLSDQSSAGKQLIEAKTTLSSLESRWNAKGKEQLESARLRQRDIASTEKLYQSSLEQWQQFNTWFHIICAGLLAVLSLAGLIGIIWRRAFLPLHLVLTIGALSVLGIAGAGFLWKWQETARLDETVKPVELKLEPTSDTRVRVPADEAPLKTPLEAEKGREQAFLNKDAPSSKVAQTTNQPTDKSEVYRTSQPTAPDAAMGGAAAMPKKKDTEAEATRANKKDDRPATTPPAVVIPPSKTLGLRGAAMTQNDTNFGKEQSPQRAVYDMQAQRMTKLADNRAALNRDSTASLQSKTKQGEAVADEKEVKKAAPSFAGGAGGGAGAGFKGNSDNLERSGQPSTTPGATKETAEELRKRTDPRDMLHEEIKAANLFYVRDYAWKADARPGAAALPTVSWSKTIYWHPLQVVPSSGKLELPIELPSPDGAYQFEVFGHDGQGRLGAASIEVKATRSPVSMQLKLSTPEARVGDTVRLECQVQNVSSRRQAQVCAKILLPEGVNLSANFKQLRYAVKKANSTEALEPTTWYVQDRELTLIWAELNTEQKVRLNIELTCVKAGNFTGIPSRAYLENQEQDAMLVPGLNIKIRPGT